METNFDSIVIGAGHAGVEAGLALARLNHKTLLVTLSLDSISFMACNPSIGGTSKGHLVREIDALGGEMAKNADKTCLQLRMLNLGKGAAVQSLRGQQDKIMYHHQMKKTLETTKNLTILQGEAAEILTENNVVCGVKTTLGTVYSAKSVVVCTGVYLNSNIIIGEFRKNAGPSGFEPATKLTASLINLNIPVRRFKTGTPARVLRSSIDFSKMEAQYGDNNIYPFSFMTDGYIENREACYLAYTNENTHQIIRDNIGRSPLYNGSIKSIGPRYCPSIEDKVMRFADKTRHQIFIEPESALTDEVYVQGMSSSMPNDVQIKMYESIVGMENVKILRYAYAIEYDCIDSTILLPTLAVKHIAGLYMAGQICGSSGYEEAAAQGLIAGINASLYMRNEQPLILKRSDAYIGVLIDDLVTKGTNEPYRMMTARAEYRLFLRQENADLRLTEFGRKVGLVDDVRYNKYLAKVEEINKISASLNKIISPKVYGALFEKKGENANGGLSYKDMLKRGNIFAEDLQATFEELQAFDLRAFKEVETNIKYEGYLAKQDNAIQDSDKLEKRLLSPQLEYKNIEGLRLEARLKLDKIKPLNLAQASRISGVSPADITVLMVYLQKQNGNSHKN
ncbi:MAG: tRNA uridine-5-carboxymethylaminomethyl(34) synthesis enzyme MnmG [Clostridia bacterium]